MKIDAASAEPLSSSKVLTDLEVERFKDSVVRAEIFIPRVVLATSGWLKGSSKLHVADAGAGYHAQSILSIVMNRMSSLDSYRDFDLIDCELLLRAGELRLWLYDVTTGVAQAEEIAKLSADHVLGD